MPIDDIDDIRKRLQRLFDTQQLAVVATSSNGQPYTSLVAYVASADLRQLFFITSRATRKYANLKSDSRVSVLINSSTNTDMDFHRAVAVTVVGDAEEWTGEKRQVALSRYLAKHPYLEEFAHAPTCALICIQVRTYLLVRNFQHVMEWHPRP
jgi:nitroimidazol reductase NimA-like FMN-containing flavoprotein (pyridoxamine 5'-phosphate oxidase superfamily)